MKYIFILFVAALLNNYDKSSAVENNKIETTTQSQLVAVAVIYRHGDRAPFVSFPNDQFYNLSYWPMGFGHLTTQGIDRHYKLGKWFRQRYITFLSEIYSPQEIYAQSTNTDRCLMSAAANLAGLYPPKDYQIWNDRLHWQPIPVHIGYETNVMSIPCPKYDQLHKKVMKVIYQDFKKKYEDVFGLIGDHTGWKNLTMVDVGTLRSVFYSYKNYNISFIPKWAKLLNQEVIDRIAGVRYSIATTTPTLARLQIGTFYNYIFNHFDKFTNSSVVPKPPKFMMMASHDTTITSIMHGMGVYKMRPVGYGDTLIMEMRRRTDGSFLMNLLYKLKDQLEQLTVGDCNFDCDYDKLTISLKNVTIDVETRRKECAEEKA